MPKVNDLKQFILMERQQRNNLAAFNLLTKKEDAVEQLRGYLNSNNKRSNILHIDDLKYGQPSDVDLKIMTTRLKLLQTSFDELSLPKPFKNSSEETDMELKFIRMLRKLSEDPETIRNIEEEDKDLISPFLRFAQAEHLPVDEHFLRILLDDVNSIAMRFKYMSNRPRPQQLATQKDLELITRNSESANTPSYPSAHSVAGRVIGKALGDKYPDFAEGFEKIGASIGLHRLIAGLHYPTDHAAGVMLGDQIYAKGLVRDHTNFMMPESDELVRAVQAAVTKHAEGFNLNKSIDDMSVLVDIFKADDRTVTVHSGGAEGSDDEWAKAFPDEVIGHSFKGHSMFNRSGQNILEDSRLLSEENQGKYNDAYNWLVRNGDSGRRRVSKPYSKKLMGRNWEQVKDSDAVLGVIEKLNGNAPAGGTGVAIAMGMQKGIPVHVFNQETGNWLTWNPDSNAWDATDVADIPHYKNFAGVGSRKLGAKGKEAIQAYAGKIKTFQKGTEPFFTPSDTPQAGGGNRPKTDPDIQGFPLGEGEEEEMLEAMPWLERDGKKNPKYADMYISNWQDENGEYIPEEKRVPLTDEQKKNKSKAKRLYAADHKAWLEEVADRPSRKGQKGFNKTDAQKEAEKGRGTPGDAVVLSNMQAELETKLKDIQAARMRGDLTSIEAGEGDPVINWTEDDLTDAIEDIEAERKYRLESGIGMGGSLTTSGQDMSGRLEPQEAQEGFLDDRISEELGAPVSRYTEEGISPADAVDELESKIVDFYDRHSGATHYLVLEPADYRTTVGVDDYSGNYRLDPHDPENNSVGVQNPRGLNSEGNPVQQSTTRDSGPIDVRGVLYDTATGEQLTGENLIKYLHERGQSDYGLEQEGGTKTRGREWTDAGKETTVGEDRQWPSRLGSGHHSPANSMVTIAMRQSRDTMMEDLNSDMAIGFMARQPDPDLNLDAMSDFDLLKTWVAYDQSKFATKENPRLTMNTSATKIKGTAYADKNFKQMSPEEMKGVDKPSYDKLLDPETGTTKWDDLKGVQSSLFGGRFTVGFVADKDRWNKLYDADTGMIAQLRALAKGYNTLKYGSEWVKYDKSANELAKMRKAYQKQLDTLNSNQEDEEKRIHPEAYHEQKTFYETRVRDTQEQQQALQLVSKKDSDPASLSYYADEVYDLLQNINMKLRIGDSLPELHQLTSMIDELHGNVFEKVTVDPTAPRAKSEAEAEAILSEYLDSSNYTADVEAARENSAEETEADQTEFLDTFQSQIDSLRAGDYEEGDGRKQSQVDVFFNGIRNKKNNFEGDGGIFADSIGNSRNPKEARLRQLMFAAFYGAYSPGREGQGPKVLPQNMAGFLGQNWVRFQEEVHKNYEQDLLDKAPDSLEPPERPETDLNMREDEAGDAYEARQNTDDHQKLDGEWAVWKAQVKDLSEKDREGVLEEWAEHRAKPSKAEYLNKIRNEIFLNPEHFFKDGKGIYKGQDIWRDMFLHPVRTDLGVGFIDRFSKPGGVGDKIERNLYEKAVKKPGAVLEHVSLSDIHTFARAVADENKTINNINTFFAADDTLGRTTTATEDAELWRGEASNKLSRAGLDFLQRGHHSEYREILTGLADMEASLGESEFQPSLTGDSTLDPVAQELRKEIMNRVGKATLKSIGEPGTINTIPTEELQTDPDKPSFNLIQLVRNAFITDANGAKTASVEEGKTIADAELTPLFKRGVGGAELSYTAPNMIYGADETDMERNLFEILDHTLFNSERAFYPELSDENILGNEQLAARRGIIEDIIDEELKRDEETRTYTDVREFGSNYDTSPEKYAPIIQAVFKRVGDMKRDESDVGGGFASWKLNTIPDADVLDNDAEAQTKKGFPVGRAPRPFGATPNKDAADHIEDMRRIDAATDEDIAAIRKQELRGATDASGKLILTPEKVEEEIKLIKERRDNWYFQTFGIAHTFGEREGQRKWKPQPNVPRPENYRDWKTESDRKKYLDTEAYKEYGESFDTTSSNTSNELEKETKRLESLADISPEELETFSSLEGRRGGYYEAVKEKLLETSRNKITEHENKLERLRRLDSVSGAHLTIPQQPNLLTYPTTWEDDYQNEHKISASEADKQWKEYDSNEFSTREQVVKDMQSLRTQVELGLTTVDTANKIINSRISETPRGIVEGVTKPAGSVQGRMPDPIQTTRQQPSPHSTYGTRFDEEDKPKSVTRMGASRGQESKNPTTSERLEGATTDVPASDPDPTRRIQRRFLRTQEADKRNERRRREVVRAAQEGAGTKSKATTSSGGQSRDDWQPAPKQGEQLDLFTYAKLKPGQRTDEQKDQSADERRKALGARYTQRVAQDVVVQADKPIPPEGTS